ncbi:MAG: helix-turn-helix domain-containing protein [Verrucomicrobiales bacterium]
MSKRRTEPADEPTPEPVIKPTPVTAGAAKDLMTTRELMDYLQVSRTKVWELVRDKQNPLPAFKLGGDYRYRRSEIDAWMESLRVRPEEDTGKSQL